MRTLELIYFLFAALPAVSASFQKQWNSQEKAYYSPPQHFPILAKVTPVDESKTQNALSFYAYIYPTSISPLYYPFYSVLCRSESATGGSRDIKVLKEEYLNPLNDKMKELSSTMKELSAAFVVDAASGKSINAEQIPPLDVEVSTANQNVAVTDGTEPSAVTDASVTNENQLPNDDTKQSNVQSRVFQCEGIDCPADAQKCKITENAIEPTFEKILKTVYCLSSADKVLLQVENERDNPNKGSSLNASRTVNRESVGSWVQQLGNNIDNKVQNAWKDFNSKFSDAFKPKKRILDKQKQHLFSSSI